MVTSELNGKSLSKRKARELPARQIHVIARADRAEQDAENEMRLLAGREMIRAICVWAFYRSEHGRHYMCKDLLDIVIDRGLVVFGSMFTTSGCQSIVIRAAVVLRRRRWLLPIMNTSEIR